MKKLLVWIFILLWILLLLHSDSVHAEEMEPTDMYVTASVLNGRAKPTIKSSVEAFFDNGDVVHAISWSKNRHWIEVEGGENGTVWVWWEYVSERTDEFTITNDNSYKVKIRKKPGSTVIGYLKPGKTAIIDRVIFGWGHCQLGWIDLNLVTEIED